MLKRLYVDNFRCLEDFELNFDSINLFLGDNGAGKSTVFDILGKLKEITTNPDINIKSIFNNNFDDFTRWSESSSQKNVLEIKSSNDCYRYELEIEKIYDEDLREFLETCITHERLYFNEELLVNVGINNVEIYSDNYAQNAIKNQSTRYNYYQSVFPFLKPSDDNQKIIWFRERMKRLIILKTNPFLIQDVSSQRDSFLKSNLENYVSWYRYIFDNNQDKHLLLIQSLQEVFDGFVGFKLEHISGKTFMLRLLFKDEDSYNIVDYALSELSDGEKMLIVLYSLFHGLESQDYTICIDEPDNFLALPEIQPWLVQLYDLCSEGKLQALLISHHPELIDYLLASPIGYWFKRKANHSVEVTAIDNNFLQSIIGNDIEKEDKSALKMSELIARGWLDE